MDMTIVARIRKLLEGIDKEVAGGDPREVTLTQQLELLTAQGAAPYREITKMGRAFWTGQTAAVASVVAIPTTAANVALYNNAPDGGRSLVIDWIAASCIVSTAVDSRCAQLLALVGQAREAIPTAAALTIKKMNGLAGGLGTLVDSVAIPVTAALPGTPTGIAANWFPWGPSIAKSAAVGTPGQGLWAAVDGRIIVAPGRYFAINVMSNAVGETFQGYIGWHEMMIDLG
jgi:hypothetical protein